MTPEMVITVGEHAVKILVILVSILLLPSLAIGVLISMFQAATQINEMTLTFIPKLLVVFAVLLIAGSWMLRLLVDYTTRLLESIPGLIG